MEDSRPLFKPKIFDQFANVVVGMSEVDCTKPNDYGMLPIDDPVAVANLADFTQRLGFDPGKFVVNREVHEDSILVISNNWGQTRADSTITQTPGWLIGVTSGDCVGALIYDPKTQAYGIFHSGWRGCQLGIAGKVVKAFGANFGSRPEDLVVYLNPAICGNCFEIAPATGEPTADIKSAFDTKYIQKGRLGTDCLDHRAIVVDQLKDAGIRPENLEVDQRCSFEDTELHSDRREHLKTARIVAAIGIKA